MPDITNRRLVTSLSVLSALGRGSRPKTEDLEELREYASDSERSLPPDELACVLVQRELDEFRACRTRLRMTRASAA